MMKIWMVAAAVVAVLIVGFIIVVPHTNEDIRVREVAAPIVPPVFIHDAYKKGLHTLAVSVAAANPCAVVQGHSVLVPRPASSSPAVASVALTIAEDSGVCLQSVATTTLSFSLAGPSTVQLIATVNGQPAPVVRY